MMISSCVLSGDLKTQAVLAEPEVKREVVDKGGEGGESKKEDEEEEEAGGEEEDDGEESGSDDPDRLWCICQKPHDDRCEGQRVCIDRAH